MITADPPLECSKTKQAWMIKLPGAVSEASSGKKTEIKTEMKIRAEDPCWAADLGLITDSQS